MISGEYRRFSVLLTVRAIPADCGEKLLISYLKLADNYKRGSSVKPLFLGKPVFFLGGEDQKSRTKSLGIPVPVFCVPMLSRSRVV